MKKGKKKKVIRQEGLEGFAQMMSELSGLDLPELAQELPRSVRHWLCCRNVVWIEAEDVSANGPAVAAAKITAKDMTEVREQCARLLRAKSNRMWKGPNFYWSFSSKGRLIFIALLGLDMSVLADVGSVIVGIDGLLRASAALSDQKALSFIDDVTELYNQRYLHLVLDKEIRRAERMESPFSVIFIDIDHFKTINDQAGHLVGSKLLRQVSDILRQNIRIIDYGFRYGGDEFILILVGTATESALAVGERIRGQIESTSFIVDSKKVNLTLSVGVATFPDHARTKEEILKLADEAMYESKHKSRNVVSVAS